MNKRDKILIRILSGNSDNNIDFKELCGLLISLGFKERVKGDHHIFYKHGVVEIINIQPKGSKANSYQVRQIREIVIKYKLAGGISG